MYEKEIDTPETIRTLNSQGDIARKTRVRKWMGGVAD